MIIAIPRCTLKMQQTKRYIYPSKMKKKSVNRGWKNNCSGYSLKGHTWGTAMHKNVFSLEDVH
jgi:hypothetical protein